MTVGEISAVPGRRRYRVVLTGELMPGHAVEAVLPALARLFQTPAADLRKVFEGGQHPIDQTFSGDDALDMQERLEHFGVRARVERVPERDVKLILRSDVPAGGTIERVASFDQAKAGTEPAPAPEPLAPEPVRPSPLSHAEARWHQAWGDPDDQDDFAEPDRSAMFVGPENPYYKKVFERFSKDGSPNFALSWNWAAVLSPFLWALYRKLWLWALLIGITEVVVPVLALVLGLHNIVSAKLVFVAYLGFIGNRLFWPALVNYLYFRHVDGMLMRLHGLAPYVADVDVATTGGISKSAVFVGLAFSGVLTLFVWSFLDSMQQPGHQVENRLATLPEQGDLMQLQDSAQLGAKPEQLREEENRWAKTRSKLRTLGQSVNQWMASKAVSGDPATLNLFKLREDMDLPPEALLDGWKNSVQYIPDNEGYRLISAGPDQLFGTADDIQYRRVLNR